MMNKVKLREAEQRFFERYPGGFSHPDLLEIVKKHKVDKMKKLAQDSFAVEQFDDTEKMIESMIKVVSQSSLVSVFEKPKFKEAVLSMSSDEKKHLVKGLKAFLHGDQALGFGQMAGLLQEYKIAKWPILTVFTIYFRPGTEVFIKPTTAKGIIEHFELTGLKYNAKPTFDFYRAYREQIMQMKQGVAESLRVDNAAFCGFLMMSIEGESD